MIHIAFYWLYFDINSSCVLKVIESIRDEQMKKIFFGPNMYQAKSGVI